jgi:ubiquinone/menaquinone biosynthesis C-methylase UbiE
MDHTDHVALLAGGVPGPGGVWADLGSGHGAFTLALADLVGSTAEIYTVDKNGGSLRSQRQTMKDWFPEHRVQYLEEDFTRPLRLPPLDGLVMANSLHYVRRKDIDALRHIVPLLKPGGRFILVEYNTDSGNPWVPHPLSFPTWQVLSERNGLSGTTLLHRVPSRFLHEIYSAQSLSSKSDV